MEEIVKKVSDRTGVPVEVVNKVIHDLWRDVKRYTYRPHEMLSCIVLGNVLKLAVRYKMVKRLSYQYADHEFPKFRQLASYYKVLSSHIEQYKYSRKGSKTPQRLEELYEKKFGINKNEL